MIQRLVTACAGALCGIVLGTGLSGLPISRPETGMPTLVSDAHGGLEGICIHYRADFAPYGLDVYSDFFGALGRNVRVHVVVEEQADFTALEDALAARDVPGLQRLSPIVTGFTISAWAKDRFGTMSRGGRAIIAVPPALSMPGGPRGNDERVPELLYKRLSGVEYEVLPFNFEGGDLLSDEDCVYVAANFLARNQPLDRDGRAELLERIGRCFGKQVIPLGTDPAGVPDHHIGMYLTPLGDNRVAAADPDLGLQLLGRDGLSHCGVDVETDPKRYIPFSNVIEQLRDEGIEVVRIPMLLTKTPRVYVTYNNAICERVNGTKRIYMPVYGIPELDGAATARFEEQGWEVHPVRVESVYRCTGSLRCLVGVIKRSS
jgi:hypothetical protein